MGNVAKQSDRRSPWAPGHPIFLLLGAALPGLLMIPLYWFQWDREEEMPPRFILLLISLCVMAVASLLWGLWSLWKRQRVSNPVWVAVSAAFAVWLTVGISSLDSFGVSTRMHWLLLCTLSMIPLFCSMAHIVFWLTPRDKAHSIKKTLLPLLALPTVWYLLANTFRYSYGYYANGQDSGSSLTIVLMLAVVFTYCFLFILVRVLYLLARRQSFWRITRAVIVFVLPLLGLLVTQLTPDFSFFWDFSHPIYYILVVLNGILLYLREPENNRLRLLLFSARCATYLFVTYFFVCISPFYTLSLLGILIFGLGLLVLAPVFLWMYQTRLLLESGMELAHRLGKQGLLKIGASALAGS